MDPSSNPGPNPIQTASNTTRVVFLMEAIVANSPRKMNANGRTWERILSLTGQPKTAQAVQAGSGAVTARTIF